MGGLEINRTLVVSKIEIPDPHGAAARVQRTLLLLILKQGDNALGPQGPLPSTFAETKRAHR